MSDDWTADELLVAEALLELPYKIFSWGRKRRRSAIQSEDPPQQQLWLPRVITSGENKNVLGEEGTPSPTTPLCFAPSETESKFKPTQNNNNNNKDLMKKKRMRNKQHNKRDELKATIAKLSKQGEELREALNKVRNYYEEQKRLQLNLQEYFKSRQLKIEEAEPIIEVTKADEPITVVPREEEEEQAQSEPSINNQKAMMKATTSQCPNAQVRVSGMEEKRGSPHGLPDLNLSVFVEDITVDLMSNKAVCAEARKRRYEINREKRAMAFVKPR